MKQNHCPAAGRCSAYEERFSIPLFNAAVQLAITTTEAPKQVSRVQDTLCGLPWYEKADSAAFFEPYSIRYVVLPAQMPLFRQVRNQSLSASPEAHFGAN